MEVNVSSSSESHESTPDNIVDNKEIADNELKAKQFDNVKAVPKEANTAKNNDIKKLSKSTSKNSKHGRASTKKLLEDKSLEFITKELSKLSNTEEKLSTLTSKYKELYNEYFSHVLNSKQTEKNLLVIQKEKESLQADYSKAVLHRSKLEDLSRELQRQNRTVKEESLLRVREEEEKRKEASGKFQTALNDISSMLQENQTQSSKLQEENVEMAKKLKVLYDQYHLREKHVEQLIHQRELETKLCETKVAKMKAEVIEDKERHMIEKKKLLEEVMTLQKRCTVMATNELTVRTELKAYKDKYEEFQENLKANNSIFDRFKSEMNKMAKKIGKLEKETLEWQNRWKASNNTLISMVEDKQKLDQQLLLSAQKISKLESLCRALQHERNALRTSQSQKTDLGSKIDEEKSIDSLEQAVCPNTLEEGSTSEAEVIAECKETLYSSEGSTNEAQLNIKCKTTLDSSDGSTSSAQVNTEYKKTQDTSQGSAIEPKVDTECKKTQDSSPPPISSPQDAVDTNSANTPS